MAKFIINVPVESEDPKIDVELNADNALPFGRHRFSLVVVDDAGNESDADTIDVLVADREKPTAVLQGPDIVGLGRTFTLSGGRSFDLGGGVIKTYRFTYLGPNLR